MQKSGIYLTFTITIVTENGYENMFNIGQSRDFWETDCFKFAISTYKKTFNMLCGLVIFIICKTYFGILLMVLSHING